MKHSKRWIQAGLAIAAALVAAATIAHVLHQREDVVATTSTVDVGSIVQEVVATGTLQAVTSVDVGTQVSGTVQSLGADFNGLVHAGQVLARLDPSSYNTELSQAQATLGEDDAQVDRAKVAVDDARQQLTRAGELFSKQVITQEDLDVARVALDSATASLKSAQAQEGEGRVAVHGAEIDLAHTVIRAPIDGIVIARDVDTGQTVAASVQTPTMFTIASDLTQMQLQANIDESDVGDLKAGDAVTFTVDAYPHETFKSIVSVVRLEPVAEGVSTSGATSGGTTSADRSGSGQIIPPGSVVSYITIINVANPDERLRPGMTATITIETARHDHVLRIARSALAFHPSGGVLQKAGERPTKATQAQAAGGAPGNSGTAWLYQGGQFTAASVRTGLADAQRAEVLSGPLQPGEQVVTGATLQKRN
jgi:HlyD family secretion protein